MARDTLYTLYSTGRTDPTYQNIWGFSSRAERNSFLAGKTPHYFEAQKYWRAGQGIKCAISYEDAFKYDYVQIINHAGTADAQTWYCFIVGRIYISPNVTQFLLDVDYVQTFYFDGAGAPFWSVPGFIAMATSATLPPRGTGSEYPVPESEAYINSVKYFGGNYAYVIYSTLNLVEWEKGNKGYQTIFIDGVMMAAAPYVIWGPDQTAVANKVTHLVNDINSGGYTDAISGIYAVPDILINTDNVPANTIAYGVPENLQAYGVTYNKPTNCGGYVPKNKVLLGYDYSYVVVNNGQGETSVWHFEDFYNDQIAFDMELSVTAGYPVINLKPVGYRYGDNNDYRQFTLKCPSPVSCSYLNDSYRIWMAQTQNSRQAAIDGAQLALAHAREAREKSFAVMLGTTYDKMRAAGGDNMFGVIGKTVNDLAENGIPTLTWNPISNPGSIVGQIGSRIVNTVGSATYAITNRVLRSVESAARGVDKVFDTTAEKINSVAGGFLDWANNLAEAGSRKMLGIEQAYVYDQAVENAQQGINALIASYRDKSRIPATAAGSNAYGDLAKYDQYGFMTALYTPTAEWAMLIDLNLSASGHIVNRWANITREHKTFDFVQAVSARVPVDLQLRPQYVRNMLVSLLASGVYLWYYADGDISPYIGMPYQLDNPGV